MRRAGATELGAGSGPGSGAGGATSGSGPQWDFSRAADAAAYAEAHRNLFGNMTDGLINITKEMDYVPHGDEMRKVIWTNVAADMDKTGEFHWEVFRQAHLDAYPAFGYAPVPGDWLWKLGDRVSGVPIGATVGPFALWLFLINQLNSTTPNVVDDPLSGFPVGVGPDVVPQGSGPPPATTPSVITDPLSGFPVGVGP
jgi:hypothetical protein